MAVNTKLLVAQIAILFLVIAVVLFLPAGTIAWRSGWIFFGLFLGFVVAITSWLYGHDPGLLQERMIVFKPGQEVWDKVLYIFMEVLFFAWLGLMPLDAARFHWSRMPVWLQVFGAIILLCSFYLFFLTFRENPYLSSAVRIQKERGQTVISTGPYHFVRHPMYSAFIPFVFGTALLLGSWYGVLLGPILVVIVARRAVLEERILRNGLKGYDIYMVQVKYRLIPRVW
ncbi:MAG TPA: isoprenylcysteine carboxylmethyltransferase family protein [Nitrospirota bacterium]|nr:isoprenylcysteine carboxylmethyltransferase family protein [Nitrospirota bacterium]